MGKAELALVAVALLAAVSIYNLYDNMEPKSETMFSVWTEMHGKHYTAAEK
jgi:hypothetical protein